MFTRIPARPGLVPAVVALSVLVFGGAGRFAAGAATASDKVDFNRHIRPILSDNCFHCHGPDEKTREAGLRLDTRDGLLKDLGGYAAVKPRDPGKSELLVRMLSKDPDEVMPPPEAHKHLKPEQLELVRKWIQQGAEFQEHWSFVTPVQAEVPKAGSSRWVKNPVDRFIAAKLAQARLKPQSEASREVLIRRVTFDLTGLPPTPAEVDAFLADKSPEAYERLVDRLLASPRYGEHMARYWLDLARYGDTHGLHLDNERSMWPYRDWVVKAFNENVPFDDFTVWQLAGDLLPNATRDQQIASGFNRCNVTTSEGGSIAEEFIVRYAVDRTQTAVEVWMGLTAGCAVCHDHKFDPISQKEFYSLYAFFNSAADPAMDGNALLTQPILKLTTPEQDVKLAAFDQQIGAIKKRITTALKETPYSDPATNGTTAGLRDTEQVWLDDAFPPGAELQKAGHDAIWIAKDVGPVFSGRQALMRTAEGLAQDYYEKGATALEVRSNATLFAHVYLDAERPPKAIMLQFRTKDWSHRAVWGDIDVIGFGKKDTAERLSMGSLPEAGKWVRLEVDAAKLGLKRGSKITGLAYTQADGIVYWDRTGQKYLTDPTTDPDESLAVWEKQNQGKVNKAWPKEIQNILRSVQPKDRTAEQNRSVRDYYLENVCNGTRDVFDSLRAELQPIEAERKKFDDTIPATFVMKDMEQPREAFVLSRGQYNQPTAKVTRNVPAIFPPLPGKENHDRLDLANWLVSPEHPLTARVAVNRYWQQFFGTGLVKTSGDFGSQGEPPSHPALLDWLATEFIRTDWDVKVMVKLLVTSATYRQDSKATPKLIERDPENRLLARGPRFRLGAEQLRDNALYLSGLIDLTMGGKGVRPYQPENVWEPVAYSGSNTKTYVQDKGNALYRRSLYTFLKRTAPPPFMTSFDGPSRESSCTRREQSNTPMQALQLMNDVQHFEAARAFAERTMAEGGRSPESRLSWAFRAATSRQPEKRELAVLKEALDAQLLRYRADAEAANQVINTGESKPNPVFAPEELAAYTLVANLILNLDETVTKN